jgi:hypothetical protein
VGCGLHFALLAIVADVFLSVVSLFPTRFILYASMLPHFSAFHDSFFITLSLFLNK